MARIPLSIQILLAIILGISASQFINTLPTFVDPIANGFIALLQMTAIPYIALSLVIGVSQLTTKEAIWSIKPVLGSLGLLGSVLLIFIFSAPLAFPNWQNAEFYSANTIQVQEQLSLISLFIPSNPFTAFTQGNIPSVVFFSFVVGLGLIPLANKAPLLTSLMQLKESITLINKVVMQYSPIAIFCIAMRSMFTIESQTIDGLIVYLATALLLVLILCWVVLPVFVSMLTPFSYRQILQVTRSAMITAFATGSFLLVIPTLVEKSLELFKEWQADNKNLEKVPEIVVPISFTLPIGGKLLGFLFPLFAAWFSGATMHIGAYFDLIVQGTPYLFGSTSVAMPKLLELFNISSSMFEIFLVAENLLASKLVAMLSVMSTFVLVLLITSAVLKKIKLNTKRLMRAFIILPCLSIAALLLLRFALGSIDHQYQGYDRFIERDLIYQQVKHRVIEHSPEALIAGLKPSSLASIKRRGFLRVGYFRDDLPYAFHNKKGELVGFDIAIMHHIASDLGVEIEFVKIFHNQAKPLLDAGYLDLTTGIPVIPDNMAAYNLSIPYSEQTIAFMVKDERRAEFTNWENIVQREDIIIGVPETFFYKDAIRKYFTNGTVWEISTPRLFFKDKYQHIDAMLFGAPSASGWNLLHPDYTVVVPQPRIAPVSLAFPINSHDAQFERYMRNWILMKQKSGTLDRLFNYWISGQKPNDVALPVLPHQKVH